jgi:hypothetical protein
MVKMNIYEDDGSVKMKPVLIVCLFILLIPLLYYPVYLKELRDRETTDILMEKAVTWALNNRN